MKYSFGKPSELRSKIISEIQFLVISVDNIRIYRYRSDSRTDTENKKCKNMANFLHAHRS